MMCNNYDLEAYCLNWTRLLRRFSEPNYEHSHSLGSRGWAGTRPSRRREQLHVTEIGNMLNIVEHVSSVT